MKIVEFLCSSFPTSPALAEFLIEIFPFLHDYDRACLRLIISILLQSVPCAGFHVWQRAVEIGSRFGTLLAQELTSYAERVYPNWKR